MATVGGFAMACVWVYTVRSAFGREFALRSLTLPVSAVSFERVSSFILPQAVQCPLSYLKPI